MDDIAPDAGIRPGRDLLARREHLERSAVQLFGVAALAIAVVCGAIIVSGWFAGVIQDAYERVFWAGALSAGLAIVVLAGAAWPGGADDRRTITRITRLVRAGLVLVVLAPALCVGALVADFFL